MPAASRRKKPSRAIGDMLRFRRPNATLFLVVDEVSQYVLSSKDRVDRLRAFATALGASLKGRVWLLALGQQKLDEEADQSFLIWAKDRFPPKLRVHLAATNIRDVVHKRLLQKTPEADAALRRLFDAHRADLKLFAYGCESVTVEELVEVYPMLPGHIDLILQITSALRTPVPPRAGRRPGHPRPAPAARRAVPRPAAGGAAPGSSGHPRPDLRGPAHRPRLGRPGQHGASS